MRKPEYLYNIVYDAMEKGQEFKESIIERIEEVGCVVTKESVHKVVILSRRKNIELTDDDIRHCLYF